MVKCSQVHSIIGKLYEFSDALAVVITPKGDPVGPEPYSHFPVSR